MSAIGCAQGYTALVVRQPGAGTLQGTTPAVLGELVDILDVEWNRERSRVAAGHVTVSKCRSNCALFSGFGSMDFWAYEIWIFRDGVFAFGGPVLITTVSSLGTLQAQILDTVAYVNRRKIDTYYTNTDNAAAIAFDLVASYFILEDPEVVPHMYQIGQASGTMTVEYDAHQYNVGEKWNDMVRAGMNYTTLGRYLLIYGQSAPNYETPYVIDASDIEGEIQLVKDGTNFATQVTGLGEGEFATVSVLQSYFGLIDAPPEKFSDIRSNAELVSLTDALWEERYEFRPQLVIPAGSSLSPKTEIYSLGTTVTTGTPVALPDLIPGMRYDIQVSAETLCAPGRYPMRLDQVKVTWSQGQQEKVAVSLGNPGTAPPEE